ncbi:MFS transporter [Terrilactibacillus sp. S3-3]|nr:MFS transporter [Terrilactibacillus sp. S3-3]
MGFSALTDFVPYNYRGMVLSFWGMSQGLGGIIGALLASLISTETNWRMPFETLSIVGLVLIIFYFFVEEPRKGRMEPELQALMNNGKNYNYRIKINQLFDIISKKSNLLLFFQGFFMNIATGSLIWLPTLYISKIQALGYSSKIAIIAAAFLFGIFQLGGITSSFFGYLGDVLQRKTYKGRSLMTAFFSFWLLCRCIFCCLFFQ